MLTCPNTRWPTGESRHSYDLRLCTGGDVVYGVCGSAEKSSNDGRAPAAGPAAAAPSGAALEALEALLIATAPVEVVCVGQLSSTTRRLLLNYASSAPGCRIETLDEGQLVKQWGQEQEKRGSEVQAAGEEEAEEQGGQAPSAGKGKAAGKGGARGKGKGQGSKSNHGKGSNKGIDAGPGEGVRGGAAKEVQQPQGWELLAASRCGLAAFFGCESGGGGASGGGSGAYGTGGEEAGPSRTSASAALGSFVSTLPPAVVLATWAAVVHLQPFGLTSVLRVARCWRPLSPDTPAPPPSTSSPSSLAPSHAPRAAEPPRQAGDSARQPQHRAPLLPEMALGANALRQLEVMAVAGDDGAGGGGGGGGGATLLRLLDRTHTPFGARLLRRWLVRPLCRRDLILRRQEAVAELLNAGGLGPRAGHWATSCAVQVLPWSSTCRYCV